MIMEDPVLRRALRASETGQRTRFCPEDAEIAAWFDLCLEQAARHRVTAHLTECSHCRNRVGMLARLEHGSPGVPVPEALLVRAKQAAGRVDGTGAARHAASRRRKIAGWAAAAVVVLAFGVLLQVGPGPDPVTESRTLRSAGPATHRPQIVHPVHDSSVAAGPMEVRWTGIEGSAYYQLLVLDDTGKPLVSEKLTETWWRSSDAWAPQAGGRYYLEVTAHLADGRTASSGHVAFSVPES